MIHSKAVTATVNQYCSILGLTDQELASRCGLHISTIWRIRYGDNGLFSGYLMIKLMCGLDVPIMEFMQVYKGFLEMDYEQYEKMIAQEKLNMRIEEMKARIRSMPDYIPGEEYLIAAFMVVEEQRKDKSRKHRNDLILTQESQDE